MNKAKEMDIASLIKRNEYLEAEIKRLTTSLKNLTREFEDYKRAFMNYEVAKSKKEYFASLPGDHIVNRLLIRLDNLDVDPRAMNVLREAGCETLGDVAKEKATDFLRYKNCGRYTLSKIRELLTTHGLEFGMDVDGIFIEELKNWKLLEY